MELDFSRVLNSLPPAYSNLVSFPIKRDRVASTMGGMSSLNAKSLDLNSSSDRVARDDAIANGETGIIRHQITDQS